MTTSATHDERHGAIDGDIDPGRLPDWCPGPSMQQTSPVMPEMSGTTAPDDASFTLPARPRALLLEHDRVDLLAHEATRRHLPEGTVSGFAVLGALVLFSCLVGGVTAGLVVIGVSALLAVSAALVTGHLSLAQVGGQRSANLLLGVGAAALILGSVVSQQTRTAAQLVSGTPVPASSPTAVTSPRPDVVAPPTPSQQAEPAVVPTSPTATTQPGDDAGLTLSPDALGPRPAPTEVVPAKHHENAQRPAKGNGDAKGNGNANAKGTNNGKGKGSNNGNGKGKGAAKPAKGPQKPKGTDTSSGKPEAPGLVRSGLSAVRSAVDELL